MKVAYLTNRYGLASYTFIMTEIEELRRRGHVVETFSVRAPGKGEAVSEAIAREQRNTEYFLEPAALPGALPRLAVEVAETALLRPFRALSALRLAAKTAAPGLEGHLKQIGYLVMACHLAIRMREKGIQHLHNHLGSSCASIAMLASELSGIPFSLTIHGGFIFTEPRRWALGEKIARSAFTACVSDYGRSQCMLFSAPESWSRLHVVRCGLDESAFLGPRAPVPDVRRLVCVGRLSEEKGHLVLLDAVRLVVARGLDVELALVGDGPMRSAIEGRIASLGLKERVRLRGTVGADEVRAQLRAARGFVLASFIEGLPVSVMEACAERRPVIATNVGAVSELVRTGETGWLVSPGAAEELADAMVALLRTPVDVLDEMGARGAERIARRHRARVEVATLEGLLRASIGAGAQAAPGAELGCSARAA